MGGRFRRGHVDLGDRWWIVEPRERFLQCRARGVDIWAVREEQQLDQHSRPAWTLYSVQGQTPKSGFAPPAPRALREWDTGGRGRSARSSPARPPAPA